MPLRPLRPILVFVGFAAMVYGTAFLTGGWLGTPPWSVTTRDRGREESERTAKYNRYVDEYDAQWLVSIGPKFMFEKTYRPEAPPRLEAKDFAVPLRWTTWIPERSKWIPSHVIAVGWFLSAFSVALPRKRGGSR